MKIRNKSTTNYAEVRGGKLFKLGPGETTVISLHDGNDLVSRIPWIFEEVKEVGAGGATGSSDLEAPKAPAPRSRGRGH